jgi:hypothetical protein
MQANEDLSRLDRIEIAIEKLTKDIDELRQESKFTNTKFDAYVKSSEAMTRMATTIIITAGTVTILAPLAQSVAPAIRAFLGGSA